MILSLFLDVAECGTNVDSCGMVMRILRELDPDNPPFEELGSCKADRQRLRR